MQEEIGYELVLSRGVEPAIELVTEALKEQGFGILTRIDVRETLKKKIDVDFRPYVILGACNPPLAYRALSSDPRVGLLLPCNVTVEADGENRSIVRIVNPALMVQCVENANQPEMQAVAHEATTKMKQVIQRLKMLS